MEDWLQNDKSNEVTKIIDRWIYMAPQTPHIVQAYEILHDYDNKYIQVLEYVPYSVNVFEYIKALDHNFISGTITNSICKFAF
jgi:hypothetical protein